MVLNGINYFAILTVSALSLISSQNINTKLQIDVFYESKCPDSMNFMKYQLKKAYPKVKDRVEIKFVPFGKASSFLRNGQTEFECQHGVRECEGNKFHSCVLEVIGPDNRDKQTSFVICAMEFGKNAGICAQNLGLDLIKINSCTEGEKGTKLQLEAEEYSKNVINRSGFVPTIVYNHFYKAGDFWASLDDFEGVINDKIATL